MKELENLMNDFECFYKIYVLFNMIPRGKRPLYHAFIEKMKQLFTNNDMKVLETTIGYQEAVASKSGMACQLLVDTKSKFAAAFYQFTNEKPLNYRKNHKNINIIMDCFYYNGVENTHRNH